LQHLNCEGCSLLTDNAFKYLLIKGALKISDKNNHFTKKDEELETKERDLEILLSDYKIFEFSTSKTWTANKKLLEQEKKFGLRFMNLSGCWLITDYGLRYK
jgi:hypothetical protein